MYPRILELQMDAPKRELRPSIRKLMAQGKVKIVKGRYRVKGKAWIRGRVRGAGEPGGGFTHLKPVTPGKSCSHFGCEAFERVFRVGEVLANERTAN